MALLEQHWWCYSHHESDSELATVEHMRVLQPYTTFKSKPHVPYSNGRFADGDTLDGHIRSLLEIIKTAIDEAKGIVQSHSFVTLLGVFKRVVAANGYLN
ncbi:hypothetical protein XU18_0485 [Perkinsela sp. CCAP 1560/4]|nr:hypothetical protein XU18_0485 [Perkinsela sp. CCAP 1560/4]|eukprot:KNH09207.1 hypothetical protein XU18_0485 [Perkinsela sp. CCAP 1560/4]